MRTSKCAIIGAAVLLISAAPLLGASVRAAALGRVSMSVSGTYTSATDYAAGIELAYGDQMPVDDYVDGAGPGPAYADLYNVILDSYLKAGAEAEGVAKESYHAPSGTYRPYVTAMGYSDVWDVWDWAWSHSIGEAMVGAWTPDVNQTVTVTVSYKYMLTLLDAQPGDPLQPPYGQLPEVDMSLTLALGKPGEQQLLTPKQQWLTGGVGVEIHRHSETVGYSETSPSYSAYDTTTWQVNVEGGQTYWLIARAEVDARTPWLPEPATISLLAIGAAVLVRRRRR